MYKKQTLALMLAFCGSFFFACKNEKPAGTAKPVVLESLKMSKQEGTCGTDRDSSCAKIALSYPTVKEGSDALKKSVADWTTQFLIGILNPSTEPDKVPVGQTVERAAQEFFAIFKQTEQEVPGFPVINVVEVWDTVLLNDGQHLTLMLNAYMDGGGVHPNSTVGIATFDVATGNLFKLEDLVSDLDALRAVAEKKFREERADVFQEGGFNFSPDWPFILPANTGLTNEGIYFYFVPYEVAPYAMGPTAFVIPFEEIKDLMKK